jgi:hypothetical protein
MTLTFPEFWHRWPDWPGHGRALAFDTLSLREQQECWDHLAERCRIRLDDEHAYERMLEGYEEPPPKRHQPAERSTWATSTRPGEVALSSGDPLKNIEPRLYVEASPGSPCRRTAGFAVRCRTTRTGRRASRCSSRTGGASGADGAAASSTWAAALYAIEPRGKGYWRLRDLILERLLWAPIHPEGDR